MRDTTVNKTTLVLVGILVLAAGIFAWVRSREPAPGASKETTTGETGSSARPAPADGKSAAAATDAPGPDGRAVYSDECGFCHGNDVDARSSLGGRIARISGVDGGSAYLIDLLLHGLEGRAEDEPAHPPFDHLSDAQVAAVIEYLRQAAPQADPGGAGTASAPAVSAGAVEARRSRDLDPALLSEERRRVLDAAERDRL